MKFWILLLFVAVGVKGQSDEAAADYWEDSFDDQWYQAELEKLGIIDTEDRDASEDTNNFNDYDNILNLGEQDNNQNEMDKKVEEEIEEFQEKDNINSGVNNDYQVEDNRSESTDNDDDARDPADDDKLDLIRDVDDNNDNNENDNNYDDYQAELDDKVEKVLDDFAKAFFDSSDSSDSNESREENNPVSKDDEINPLPMPPQLNVNNDDILEETKAILREEENIPNDFVDDQVNIEAEDDLKNIIEESKRIIEEDNNQFDEESDDGTQQIKKSVEENSKQEDFSDIDENLKDLVDKLDNLGDDIKDEDEDTVDKIYEDLNEDLDTLFETLNKLANSAGNDDAPVNVDYAVNSDESLDDKNDYETIFDSNLSELFAEHSKTEDENAERRMVGDEPTNKKQGSDELLIKEPISEESAQKELAPNAQQSAEEGSLEVNENLVNHSYINDALISEDNNDEPIKSIDIDELSDDQLDQIMDDFAVQHSDVFDIEQTDREQATLNHIVNEHTLKYGETKFITSDNHPGGYPVDRITDWIIIGEGEGIEMNITAFNVNSALGHYLLVKPGQLDHSGSDGLLFSYHLNSPRAYRFADVDRVFMRFDARGGFSFLTGFNITFKMIGPVPEDPEPEPEPEPLLPEPIHHFTVILGGLSFTQFNESREDFRLLIADMATMYINANGIDPGMNATSMVTQITSATVCNVHWPGFELCADVKVAVPLVYEDERQSRLDWDDLQAMWNGYATRDPFASRLRQMGITEFSVPNDGGVLMVWLVVGLGVLVSAVMLAFALWRYTCFKKYTRMPEFSDADSISHKRLDLYPTPHQTLPPLYSESEYKWDKYEDAPRVDMGGFANRSYVRTDMYDLDSDEDVVVPRDRDAGIQPRDIFSV